MSMPDLTVDVERLARALFIHVCPLGHFDAETSWDTGAAARQSWIAYARAVATDMGWNTE